MQHDFFLPSSRQWRPIFLRTAEDVDRLNALLGSGWHLMDLDSRELPLFAFYVPTRDLRPLPPRAARPVRGGVRGKKTLMLILRRGRGDREQLAVMAEPDGTGYANFGVAIDRMREEGWRPIERRMMPLRMENGEVVFIVSRKRP